ncbi:hypothetical protein TraAM80_04867 [Trypanosoma rangeli]|uniref:Uncharacterized protein n=1 Tax=Trypanosoma rangeli TaxID=5698 RepID=A0A3R7LWF3_TRYRA|nr:uncharacterized protein TraAM80_04867 [Trypanosoma rangeli]RNF04671.1 hypothetical protein TraAM80_04867 [Trypanosoma rangeli]|eukprot:RNF04671.1 hypothetical protein TraAM80_04867 [Trypanosoma rangeli]
MRWLLAQLWGCGAGRRGHIAAVRLPPQSRHASSMGAAFLARDGVRRINRDGGEQRQLRGRRLAEGDVKEEENGGDAFANSGCGSFPLGNGVALQLPAHSLHTGENNSPTHDVGHGNLEEPSFSEKALVSLLEAMHQALESASLLIVGGAKVIGSSTDDVAIHAPLEKWPDVFCRLRAAALPVLLQNPDTTPPSVSSVAEAYQTLTETLSVVDAVSKATGMRAERMFPAALVVVLWSRLPRLHAYARRVFKGQQVHAHETVPATLVGSSLSLMRAFKSARRALALRTRELSDLLPPSVLVQVLVCMEQCGALSDDIIGPIGTELLRRYKTSAAPLNGPQHVATNHLLSAHFVATAVEADTAPFQGETAIAFARLLGRLHVRNHFQLHRLMHTILLPQVVTTLPASVTDENVLFELTRCYSRYAVSGSAVTQLTALWLPHLFCMSLDQCSELLRIVGGGGCMTVGAEEDYFPLVEAILQRASVLYHHASQDGPNVVPPAAMVVSAASTEACALVSADSAASFICALAAVNSPHWGEVYSLAATALERSLDGLLVADVVRVTKALLRRNSHVPYHPLHSRLAHRLLTDEAALTDAKMGGLSLLATALMLLPSPALPAVSSSSTTPHSIQMATVKPPDATNFPALDAARALAVFRRHGKALGLRSFVAGMCVSPLAQLPRRSQESVIMHFTAIASALEVPWLVRGMVSLTSQIPQTVDPLSVQRWFSRFTAIDVARQLDIVQTAMLLNILSHDDYSRECALAKQAILKQTSKLLLQDTVPLDTVTPLVTALQCSNVFFPHLYSRLCRVLLADVRQGPWRLLLPAFHVIADEFTRRPHGNGSVFRDVWEQLRTRLVEEAASSLEAGDVVLAFNGFAALDGRDRPVFSVLLHRLWAIYQSLVVSPEANDTAAMRGPLIATPPPPTPAACMDNILAGCTPSALAVLLTTLIYAGQEKVNDTLMPWVLLRTRPVIKDLYPIDVLHLMPALLSCFTAAKAIEEKSNCSRTLWLCNPVNRTLLHATYDGCRELFLHMYEDEATARDANTLRTQRAEWAPQVHVSVSRVPRYLFADLLIALCQCEVRDEAVATASAARLTRRSCEVLPVAELVDLTMALCFHFPPPPLLTQEVIVNDRTDITRGDKDDDCDKETDDTAGATSCALAPHRRFLQPVLTALWGRVEELQSPHIDALVRCLRHYYGDKVDADFLDRLTQHKAMLAEVRTGRQRPQETATRNDCEKIVAAAAPLRTDTAAAEEEPASWSEPTTEDLFLS